MGKMCYTVHLFQQTDREVCFILRQFVDVGRPSSFLNWAPIVDQIAEPLEKRVVVCKERVERGLSEYPACRAERP